MRGRPTTRREHGQPGTYHRHVSRGTTHASNLRMYKVMTTGERKRSRCKRAAKTPRVPSAQARTWPNGWLGGQLRRLASFSPSPLLDVGAWTYPLRQTNPPPCLTERSSLPLSCPPLEHGLTSARPYPLVKLTRVHPPGRLAGAPPLRRARQWTQGHGLGTQPAPPSPTHRSRRRATAAAPMPPTP